MNKKSAFKNEPPHSAFDLEEDEPTLELPGKKLPAQHFNPELLNRNLPASTSPANLLPVTSSNCKSPKLVLKVLPEAGSTKTRSSCNTNPPVEICEEYKEESFL